MNSIDLENKLFAQPNHGEALRLCHQYLGAQYQCIDGIDVDIFSDARVLFFHITGLDRAAFMLQENAPLETAYVKPLVDIMSRRAMGEPVAYITGEAYFWDKSFKVSPDVLIPRPESEHIIEQILAHYPDHTSALRILDIGTGSGCLAICIASLYGNADMVAVDISPAALSIAQQNARKYQCRINFVQDDLMAHLSKITKPFDVIISNPPYIPYTDKNTMMKDVTDFEPSLALFAEDDGLAAYHAIEATLDRLLKPKGTMILEHGYNQSADIVTLYKDKFSKIDVVKDLSGHNRLCVGLSKI